MSPRGKRGGGEAGKFKACQELLEFYFGDSNLRADKFLQKTIEKNPEGWVPISVLATFKKLAKAANDEIAVMREGAKLSDELEVSKSGEEVRRVRPLPEVDDSGPRTVYVEGISEVCQHDEVKAALEAHGKVLYVNKPQMATMQNSVGEDGAEQQTAVRKNMGYCFVEFSSVGEAAAAVKAGEDGCVSLDGKQLKVTTKEAWASNKKKFREAQKKQGAAKSQMMGAAATTSNGLVLHFQGATGPLTWLQAREIFEAFAPVAHAEMRDAGEGERAEGYMRFESAKGARLCLAHMQDRKMRIGGSAISLRMLTDSEENDYLARPVHERREHQRSSGYDASRRDNSKHDEHLAPPPTFTAGLLVSFTVVQDTPPIIDYRVLRKAFSAVAPVEFLDFDPQAKQGCVRMSSAQGALQVCNAVVRLAQSIGEAAPAGALEGNLLRYVKSTYVLEGEPETSYWSKVHAAKLARAMQNSGSGGGQQQGQGKDQKKRVMANGDAKAAAAAAAAAIVPAAQGKLKRFQEEEEEDDDDDVEDSAGAKRQRKV